MKFVVISDTHGKHNQIDNLPCGDIIIHAGDISKNGKLREVVDFSNWFSSLNYKYKILIAGNHDKCLELLSQSKFEKLFNKKDILYLNDSGVEIGGIKIWGSPIQPSYKKYAFNKKRGFPIKRHWDMIPENIDIIVTHGPSYCNNDKTISNLNIGCKTLSSRISAIKPKYHLCGHVHESYGVFKDKKNGVIHMNASLLDVNKKLANRPLTFKMKGTLPVMATPLCDCNKL